MEGCSKLWLKLIFENLVSEKWMSWEAIETIITGYKFRNKDAANRPAPLRAQQMKNKESRKVIIIIIIISFYCFLLDMA